WCRLYEREKQNIGAVRIREFDRAREAIVAGPAVMDAEQSMKSNAQIAPLGILSVDWRGNLSSFSPELLGLKCVPYGDFVFGDIHTADPASLRTNAKF